MDLARFKSDLDALQQDKTLDVETNLRARVRALDLVSFVLRAVREIRHARGPSVDLDALERQAQDVQRWLEPINARLFARLRATIQSGNWTTASLRHEFGLYTDYAGEPGQVHLGYDGLDALVDGVLLVEPAPQETRARAAGMIHYEPTPARVVLDMIDHAGLTCSDVFYDLGSGLGQVVILARLLGGAKAKGIEYEPAFCAYAQRCVQRLRLTGAEFINADARDVSYADGTVFFMFAPFTGAVLRAVLEKLRVEVQKRPIKVCTYGPCTPQMFEQRWLRSLDAGANHEFKLAIFERRRHEP